MEVQWKYNGENTQLASLFHYGRMSSALSWNTQNLKWRSGQFETSCFCSIFLLFLTILEASPMMCLHILALGIVICWIIHYERDILSITWRDGPLLQIQEAGPALHLPYPPLLVLDHPRHKTTLAHFVYQLEVWAEWFCSQSRYHQTFRGPEQMEYSS